MVNTDILAPLAGQLIPLADVDIQSLLIRSWEMVSL